LEPAALALNALTRSATVPMPAAASSSSALAPIPGTVRRGGGGGREEEALPEEEVCEDELRREEAAQEMAEENAVDVDVSDGVVRREEAIDDLASALAAEALLPVCIIAAEPVQRRGKVGRDELWWCGPAEAAAAALKGADEVVEILIEAKAAAIDGCDEIGDIGDDDECSDESGVEKEETSEEARRVSLERRREELIQHISLLFEERDVVEEGWKWKWRWCEKMREEESDFFYLFFLRERDREEREQLSFDLDPLCWPPFAFFLPPLARSLLSLFSS
jgi:hypothetical protein